MTEMSRVVSGGYGPRYGVFSTFAPAPQPFLQAVGCSHLGSSSCPRCDGLAEDERAMQLGSFWGRTLWLEGFPEPARSRMARWADRKYGPVSNVAGAS